MSEVLAAALAYAARGWPVFPARSIVDKAAGSKAPHLPKESSNGARDGGHWLASADPAQIRRWWARWPDALIGLPTGIRSGSVVVDLDPRDHDVDAMLVTLTLWCDHLRFIDPETGEIIEPAIARTQSGGLHLYFGYPDAATFAIITKGLARLGLAPIAEIGNRTGLFRAFLKAVEVPAELAHIDVRGEGGYVIAPPSVMQDGRRYQWLVPPESTLPPLPRRLRGVITSEFIPEAQRRAMAEAARSPARFSGRDITDERVRLYVERSVAGALSTARQAGDGNRNAAVFWAACRLGEFVRGGCLGQGEAESLLMANLPAGVNPAEKKILGTIRSGLRNMQTPAFSPDRLRNGRHAA